MNWYHIHIFRRTGDVFYGALGVFYKTQCRCGQVREKYRFDG